MIGIKRPNEIYKSQNSLPCQLTQEWPASEHWLAEELDALAGSLHWSSVIFQKICHNPSFNMYFCERTREDEKQKL